MNRRMNGRMVIVTGAAGGIGAASVQTLRDMGAEVLACDVTLGAERHLDVADADGWREVAGTFNRVDGSGSTPSG
jgi:NAD(P)-dependent dehydrogenase (short-subunit alcohol dehydrogenase family)